MQTDAILSRLDRVRATGKDKWQACCPAHDDKSPSLSIRDAGDRILLHCFGGCLPSEITTALGLELRDLFADSQAPRPIAAGISRRQLFDALHLELMAAALAAADRAQGKALSPADIERERLAWERIDKARQSLRRALS